MCAWTADHAHASRTRGRRSKQSTGFRGRMHKSLTQNFATAFLSLAIATARLTSRHILISAHLLGHVMYHYVIPFSYIHVHTRTTGTHLVCSIACGHTPIPILMYGLRVVFYMYNVYKHVVLLCSFWYHIILTYKVSVS